MYLYSVISLSVSMCILFNYYGDNTISFSSLVCRYKSYLWNFHLMQYLVAIEYIF